MNIISRTENKFDGKTHKDLGQRKNDKSDERNYLSPLHVTNLPLTLFSKMLLRDPHVRKCTMIRCFALTKRKIFFLFLQLFVRDPPGLNL